MGDGPRIRQAQQLHDQVVDLPLELLEASGAVEKAIRPAAPFGAVALRGEPATGVGFVHAAGDRTLQPQLRSSAMAACTFFLRAWPPGAIT